MLNGIVTERIRCDTDARFLRADTETKVLNGSKIWSVSVRMRYGDLTECLRYQYGGHTEHTESIRTIRRHNVMSTECISNITLSFRSPSGCFPLSFRFLDVSNPFCAISAIYRRIRRHTETKRRLNALLTQSGPI